MAIAEFWKQESHTISDKIRVHTKQKYTYNTHKTTHIQLYIGNIIAKKSVI